MAQPGNTQLGIKAGIGVLKDHLHALQITAECSAALFGNVFPIEQYLSIR